MLSIVESGNQDSSDLGGALSAPSDKGKQKVKRAFVEPMPKDVSAMPGYLYKTESRSSESGMSCDCCPEWMLGVNAALRCHRFPFRSLIGCPGVFRPATPALSALDKNGAASPLLGPQVETD